MVPLEAHVEKSCMGLLSLQRNRFVSFVPYSICILSRVLNRIVLSSFYWGEDLLNTYFNLCKYIRFLPRSLVESYLNIRFRVVGVKRTLRINEGGSLFSWHFHGSLWEINIIILSFMQNLSCWSVYCWHLEIGQFYMDMDKEINDSKDYSHH